MGLSFSAFRKELSSRRFKRAYEALEADCPSISSFADHNALIAFFHDRTADPDRKDAILFDLVARFRHDKRHRDVAPLFIVLFTPAMARIYTYTRRKFPASDREDLIQDLCFLLLQIISANEITPYKVAGRIAGELQNRFRSILNQIPKAEFIGIKGNGTDVFETDGTYAADADDSVSAINEIDFDRMMAKAAVFLDSLIRAGKISRKDKRILMESLINGRPLRDIASPRHYKRLKDRRRQVLAFIRKYYVTY